MKFKNNIRLFKNAQMVAVILDSKTIPNHICTTDFLIDALNFKNNLIFSVDEGRERVAVLSCSVFRHFKGVISVSVLRCLMQNLRLSVSSVFCSKSRLFHLLRMLADRIRMYDWLLGGCISVDDCVSLDHKTVKCKFWLVNFEVLFWRTTFLIVSLIIQRFYQNSGWIKSLDWRMCWSSVGHVSRPDRWKSARILAGCVSFNKTQPSSKIGYQWKLFRIHKFSPKMIQIYRICWKWVPDWVLLISIIS